MINEFKKAVRDDDVERARVLLDELKPGRRLNDGHFEYGKPPLIVARSREMADLLIEKGASVDRLSEWWSSGFWLMDADADVARYLVEQGAKRFRMTRLDPKR